VATEVVVATGPGRFGNEPQLAGAGSQVDHRDEPLGEVECAFVGTSGFEVSEGLLEPRGVVFTHRRGDVESVGYLARAAHDAGERTDHDEVDARAVERLEHRDRVERFGLIRPDPPSAPLAGTPAPEFLEHQRHSFARVQAERRSQLVIGCPVERHEHEGKVEPAGVEAGDQALDRGGDQPLFPARDHAAITAGALGELGLEESRTAAGLPDQFTTTHRADRRVYLAKSICSVYATRCG